MKAARLIIAPVLFILICGTAHYYLRVHTMDADLRQFAYAFLLTEIVLGITSISLIFLYKRFHYSILSILSLFLGATVMAFSVWTMLIGLILGFGHINYLVLSLDIIAVLIFLIQAFFVFLGKRISK